MDSQEKVQLLARFTQEVISEEELLELFDNKASPHAYMGFAPTGQVHTGHMIPIRKIVDFLDAGCEFTFLIADLHAYLDDNKTAWEMLDARFEYYKQATSAILKAFGAPLEKVSFVRGSDFEFERSYQENILKMVGDVTLNRAKRAASEVVRFSDEPKLGGFVYPFMQIEDVYALDADIALGGIDQRGIYMLGRDLADKMQRDKYACVFTPLLPGLTGSKMSASDESSKINVLDDAPTVKKKILKAFCPAGELEDNGVMAFLEHVIFPSQGSFVVSRPEKFGGDETFESYEQLQEAFVAKQVHPMDLKNSLVDAVEPLLSVVRENVDASLIEKAYPQ